MKRTIAVIALTLVFAGNAFAAKIESPPVVDFTGWNTPPGTLHCYSSGLQVLSQTFTKYKPETIMQDMERVDRWTENGVLVVERHYERKNGNRLFDNHYVLEGKIWKKYDLPAELTAYGKALAKGLNELLKRGALSVCKK